MLEKLRGRVAVLDFWGTWCGPCISAMPKLMDIAEQFRERSVACVAIHTPTDADFGEFDRQVAEIVHGSWDDRALPFPTLIDEPVAEKKGGRTAAKYGVSTWPTLIVIDRAGKVVGAVSKDELADVINKILD